MKTNKSFFVWIFSIAMISFLMMLIDYAFISNTWIPFLPFEKKTFVVLLLISIFFVFHSISKQKVEINLYKIFFRGLFLAFFSGCFWGAFSSIYVIINPNYTHNMISIVAKEFLPNHSTSETIGFRLGSELYYSPIGQLFSKIVFSIISGIIISILFSSFFFIVLRRRKKIN